MKGFEYKDFPITVNEQGSFEIVYNDKIVKASSLSAIKAKIQALLDLEVTAFKALVFFYHCDYKTGKETKTVKEVLITRKEKYKYYSSTGQSYAPSQLYALSERKKMVAYQAAKKQEAARHSAAQKALEERKAKIVPALDATKF